MHEVNFTIRLRREEHRDLGAKADELGVARADVVRLALRAYCRADAKA